MFCLLYIYICRIINSDLTDFRTETNICYKDQLCDQSIKDDQSDIKNLSEIDQEESSKRKKIKKKVKKIKNKLKKKAIKKKEPSTKKRHASLYDDEWFSIENFTFE